jgi:shikimate dehydrogenase
VTFRPFHQTPDGTARAKPYALIPVEKAFARKALPMNVSGTTQVVGLFGYPVRHTASPAFQNAAFRALGLDWIYLPFEVEPADLHNAITGIVALGFRGINLTIPHKQAVMEYLHDLSPEARIIGAVNTVDIRDGRLKGYNTDGKGFANSIKEENGVELAGESVFVMGAGGAGRAVAIQAALDGAAEISVCDREETRSQSLVADIAAAKGRSLANFVPFERPAIRHAVQSCRVFVDATPLGLNPGDPTSIDADWLKPSTFVCDLVYHLPETPLLNAAKRRGCKTQNGLSMLLHQGGIAFQIWTGIPPPLNHMRAALTKAILRET